MNSLATIPQNNSVSVKGEDIEVTASAPEEMVAANAGLIQWCDHKIALCQKEAADLEAAYIHAKKCKWKFNTLERQWKLELRRIEFYSKLKAALEAGYYIVPNFPVTAFAIRTDTKNPRKGVTTYQFDRHEQKASGLASGEGEYKNPFPDVYQRVVPSPTSSDPNRKVNEYFAEEWREMEFPLNMAKPRIMEASSRAMALNLFDSLGILPDPSRKADPVILGHIIDPRSTKHNQRVVSFLIAWHLDTRTL